MSSVVISGNTSGTITLDAPAVAGTTTLTLPATSGTVGIVSGDLGTPSALVGTNITGTANALNAGIGINQTWQNVTGSRAVTTTYYNTTGKPIFVAISEQISSGLATVNWLYVNGVIVNRLQNTSANFGGVMSAIVPIGGSYQAVFQSVSPIIHDWAELR
jgi:hypothetical protein